MTCPAGAGCRGRQRAPQTAQGKWGSACGRSEKPGHLAPSLSTSVDTHVSAHASECSQTFTLLALTHVHTQIHTHGARSLHSKEEGVRRKEVGPREGPGNQTLEDRETEVKGPDSRKTDL